MKPGVGWRTPAQGSLSSGWAIGSLQMGVGEPVRYWAYATNRAGSYAMNWHLLNASWYRHDPNEPPSAKVEKTEFLTESQVQKPTMTPVVVDAVTWRMSPRATDVAPFDLVGRSGSRPDGPMSAAAIPRHGSGPSVVSSAMSTTQLKRLPGAINAAFYDDHGESVKVENLWQLYWHVDYRPPLRRPGL